MNTIPTETLWHITVLSNFSRGFDKYARLYSKRGIPESTFPDRFFLLRGDELSIGIQKAHALLQKLAIPGNRLIALSTEVATAALRPNLRTGLGRYVDSPAIPIRQVAFVDAATTALDPVAIEELSARSLQLLSSKLAAYPDLQPRSFSILPIARGCQASCPFCFSEASASAEQEQARLDPARVRAFASAARERGSERFVITGGGEPGLVRHEKLLEIIAIGRETLGKAVLITNGHHLARRAPADLGAALADYAKAGLSVLAISRHHHDEHTSAELMSLSTNTAAIAKAWYHGRDNWPDLRLRLTCVLQKGGVDRMQALEAYVDWAAKLGVPEICFKELYVSTSVESFYYRHAANEWSHAHQVPLSLVLDFAAKHNFSEVARLPWGSPVFRGDWKGRPIQIAAYTEPSLLWERSQGIARSWNLMSDGRCLVSLEDRASEITLPRAA